MRILYLDPSLTTLAGHCVNYASCLRREAEERSISFEVFGSREIAFEGKNPGFEIHPTFTYDAAGRPSLALSTLRRISLRLYNRLFLAHHARAMRRDLRELSEGVASEDDTLLVFNSMRSWQILVALESLAHLFKKATARFCFILHFTSEPLPGQPVLNNYYSRIFALATSPRLNGRVRFLADSHGLVDEFIRLGCPPNLIDICPIPHTAPSLPRVENDRIVIGTIGEQRENKGFAAIPEAIAQCLNRQEIKSRCSFLLHNPASQQNSAYLKDNLEPLKGLGVEMEERALDEDAYYQFLNRLDVVLLPYEIEHYHVQTSGIFAEALSMGKIPIASRGTWMAEEMKALHAGRDCEPGDGTSLAKAIESVVTNFPAERARAERAAIRWREFHHPAALIDKLIANP